MPPPRGRFNPIEGPGDFTFTKEVHNDTYPAIDPLKADHSGHAIFIAGASKGIGRAMAIAFAKAGASEIAIGARSGLSDVVESIEEAAKNANRPKPTVLPITLDILDRKSVEEAAAKIESAFGRLDVAINSAGVIEAFAPIADSDPDIWWKTWEVNLRGTYLINRSCIPLLLKGDLKTLINLSSVAAHLVVPGLSSYQPGKLAVTRFTEFAAAEYRDQGLVAISVHPGNVPTTIMNIDEMDDKWKAVFSETSELPADSLVYLTSEKRDWLSGRYINLTWDLPELTTSPKKDEIIEKDLLRVKLAV